MRATLTAIIGLALTFGTAQAQAQTQGDESRVTPLFAEDSTLELTLDGPIGAIARNAARSTDPEAATLRAGDETHAITLEARGKSRRRRDICKFPPLRVRFDTKSDETSLFHKQGSIKLVTHCRDRNSYNQTILREYAAYRLYNLVTPHSLRVRLLRVTYMDDGTVIATRPGFFIEDGDDAARRVGRKEVDTGDLSILALNQDDAARYAVFQYLIGNTDWAMAVGPDPTDCCHNSKLFGEAKDARELLTPVPYDFDNAGLVDAPYAVPNASLGTRTVRKRVYRGFCRFNNLIAGEVARLQELRPSFEAELASIPGLSEKTQRQMLSYLANGYEDMADAHEIERNLLSKCR